MSISLFFLADMLKEPIAYPASGSFEFQEEEDEEEDHTGLITPGDALVNYQTLFLQNLFKSSFLSVHKLESSEIIGFLFYINLYLCNSSFRLIVFLQCSLRIFIFL